MRSLFTTDIPGAVPRNRYFDKHLYLERHLKEIERFGPKNPQHVRNFQWHQPLKKNVEPIQKNSYIIKPHNYPKTQDQQQGTSRLSRSLILNKKSQDSYVGKVTEGISLGNQSSIFSQAGKKSLGDSFSKDYSQNPYFPHMLPRFNGDNKSKLTGKREWAPNYVQQIQIPSTESQYFPKWS